MARLIDADAFSEQYGNYYAEEGPEEGFIGTVGELIAKQPTIDAQPVRQGRWIVTRFGADKHGLPRHSFKCSNCRFEKINQPDTPFNSYPNYCEECGAKMDGGTNNGKVD